MWLVLGSPVALATEPERLVLREGVRVGVVVEEAEVGGVGLLRRPAVKLRFLNAPKMFDDDGRRSGVCGTWPPEGDM
jgi:hypothetical protein